MIGPILLGIRAALVADDALNAVTQWYHAVAPGSATVPYGVIQYAAGGDTNETPLDELDEDWTVKIVDTDAARAMTLGDAVRTTLHNATLTLGAGWTAYDCEHTGPAFFLPEQVESTQYFHAGSTYRIRAHEEA